MRPYPDALSSFRLIYLDETDSTNNWLKELARQGGASHTVVCAGFQTSGKGQRGNRWESERNANLLFSVLLRPVGLPANAQFLLSQIISLSIKEELEQYAEGFSIKWPNDIYRGQQKICGILIENNLEGAYVCETVIGVGLNVNQLSFSAAIPNPISLAQITERTHEQICLLSGILNRLKEYLSILAEGGEEEVRKRYFNSLYRKTGLHEYADKNGDFTAEIVGVQPSGVLMLKDSCGVQRMYQFKEITYK